MNHPRVEELLPSFAEVSPALGRSNWISSPWLWLVTFDVHGWGRPAPRSSYPTSLHSMRSDHNRPHLPLTAADSEWYANVVLAFRPSAGGKTVISQQWHGNASKQSIPTKNSRWACQCGLYHALSLYIYYTNVYNILFIFWLLGSVLGFGSIS